jgi:hypothetical protein
MDFPVVEIASNPRHLGKLKKGHKVRLSGGGFSLALEPDNHKKVMKALMKGKGIHHELTPTEINENHGKGFFDTIKRGFKKVAKVAAPIVIPIAKNLANKGISALQKAAPAMLGDAGAALATFSGNPELAPLAYEAGSNLGRVGASKLGGMAHSQVNSIKGGGLYGYGISGNQPPSRHPQTNAINEYKGEDSGKLDRANMGSHMADEARAALAEITAGKRANLPTGGSGLYGGMPRGGRGLYGGGMYGGALSHPRSRNPRREMGSVGRQGNLLGHSQPPALESQALSQNFQFGHTLPPQFQKFAKSGSGSGLM